MKRIPKASRMQAATAYAQVIQEVIESNSEAAWKRLLMFPGVCFGRPKRAGKKNRSLASVVNSQISDFREGRPYTPPQSHTRKDMKPQSIANQVANKLAQGDIRGAVRITGGSDKALLLRKITVNPIVSNVALVSSWHKPENIRYKWIYIDFA